MVTKKITPSKKKGDPGKQSGGPGESTAAKKTAPRKKPAGADKKRWPAKSRPAKFRPTKFRMDTFITVAATSFFVLFGLFVAYVLLHPNIPEKSPSPVLSPPKKTVPLKIAKFEKPDFEIFPTEPILSRRAAATPAPDKKTPLPESRKIPPATKNDVRPMVVIIIDDFGYDMELAEKFLALDPALTCAVLPNSVYDQKIAALARKQGHELMLHQPMEPGEYPLVDPGPGALLTSMTPDQRIAQLNANIDRIPGICGINNHMGSKTTTLSDEMNQIFTVLKKRGLFFVDSRTTAASQCLSSARLFKVPFAERDVFLDHVRKESEIRTQIDQLVNIAEVHGRALGIGHPYEVTYEVLKKAMPELKKRVRLVPASAIVEVF